LAGVSPAVAGSVSPPVVCRSVPAPQPGQPAVVTCPPQQPAAVRPPLRPPAVCIVAPDRTGGVPVVTICPLAAQPPSSAPLLPPRRRCLGVPVRPGKRPAHCGLPVASPPVVTVRVTRR